MNAEKENDQGADDGRNAELAGLEDVDFVDIGFEGVEDLRYDIDLALVEMFTEIDRACVFAVDRAAVQISIKRRLDADAF